MNFNNIYLLASLMEWLENPLAIVGVVLAAVGLAMAFIAKRITKAVRHKSDIDSNDKVYVSLCLTGLILVIVALILVAVASSKLPQ